MKTPRRHQPSSIDKLPPEVRALIGELREKRGCTIDEIMDKLRELEVDVSRSAVGRHVRKLADIGAEMRRSREIATALVGQFGDEPDNKLARLNLELMHGVVMRTITAAAEGEDGEPQAVTFDAEQVMFLAKSMQALASAEKANSDRMLITRRETAKAAAAEVTKTGRAAGVSKETIDQICSAVLGVAA